MMNREVERMLEQSNGQEIMESNLLEPNKNLYAQIKHLCVQ